MIALIPSAVSNLHPASPAMRGVEAVSLLLVPGSTRGTAVPSGPQLPGGCRHHQGALPLRVSLASGNAGGPLSAEESSPWSCPTP